MYDTFPHEAAGGLPLDEGRGGAAPPEIDITNEPVDSIGTQPSADYEVDFTITASGDRSEEHAPETDQPAAEQGGAEEPLDASGGDAPPPGPPTEQTGQPEEPGRGHALQSLTDYAHTAAQQGSERVASLMSMGLDLHEAIDVAGTATQESYAYAQLQYGEALDQTGLRFTARPSDIGLRLVDPSAFAGALREVSVPEDPDAGEHLRTHTRNVLGSALTDVSSTIVAQNQAEARELCGGTPSPECADLYSPLPEGDIMPSALTALAASLPDKAASIAEDLDRIGANANAVTALRQLAIAQEEGQVLAWAVAHTTHLIGDTPSSIVGVDRLASPEAWDAAFRFLNHMEATAPTSGLLNEIYNQAVIDIGAALLHDEVAALGPGASEEAIARATARQEQLEAARPLLGAVLLRFAEG